nr:unnamed protein product [Digitaria exilis]
MAPTMVDAALNGQEMTKATCGVGDGGEKFAPSAWGDFFITYTSEEWMRQRSELLKKQVRQDFNASIDNMGVADLVTYVDTLERLGIDNHFSDLIEAALNRIRTEESESDEVSKSLHIVALRFRLLRQHNVWVSADVFEKFRDGGSFSTSLCSDPRGLLSLYNAAHMAIPGEVALDNAIAFARGHLEAIKGKVKSPIAEQISRALDITLPRFTRRLETMHYIAEYEHEEAHDSLLLELSRLNFNLVRALHLKELKALSLWDENEVSILPEYLRTLYIKTLGNFKEFEDSLEQNKKYRMTYAKNAYKLSSQNYLREAIWSSQKYQPSFTEHEEVSIMSSGLPMLTIITLMGYGDVATQEVFEWVSGVPEMVRAGSQVTRFLNDLSSYKLGKHKKDMPSAVETYMIEKGLTGEEAVAEIAALLENRWRILNQTNMDIDRSLFPAAQVVVNMARTNEIIYLHGRDAYTFGDDLKDLVTTLFLRPVPL